MKRQAPTRSRGFWRRLGPWLGIAAGAALATTSLRSQNTHGIAPQAHEQASQQLALPDTNEAARLQLYADGVLDFGLLRQTVLNPEPPPVFPGLLTGLEGRTVRLKGFMVPYDDLKNLRKFMLMATAGGCFFCQPPTLKDVVYVEQAGDQKRSFIDRPLEVEGTLQLWKADSPDEVLRTFLFVITNAQVRALK